MLEFATINVIKLFKANNKPIVLMGRYNKIEILRKDETRKILNELH